MQERVQRVPFSVPRMCTGVQDLLGQTLTKRLWDCQQEKHVWSSQLGKDFPVMVFHCICKHTCICFFCCLNTIFLFFWSGTGLLPALAADNAFPSAESPRRLPRVASTQRRGLLEALSHLLMEESSKLVSGGNDFSLKVKRVKSWWVPPDTKFSP